MRLTTTLALALIAFTPAAFAQQTQDVKFQAGNYGTMVTGKITGQEYADYKLGAKAGQEMFVEMTVADTNGDGSVFFNILPPGSDNVAIYNASMDGNTAKINLPETGEYTIRVYLMGNDEDAGKTVGFNMDLSIQ